jgi:hypothetical protein
VSVLIFRHDCPNSDSTASMNRAEVKRPGNGGVRENELASLAAQWLAQLSFFAHYAGRNIAA